MAIIASMPTHDLHELAKRAMRERDLEPDFPPEAQAEAERLAPADDASLTDLRALPWCSIDNDDSRDLDQLTAIERLPSQGLRLLVAVADVDLRVPRGSALDRHAARNTTSIYTAGGVFPMLPERLSTDLTSLNEAQDRAAMVVRIDIDARGGVTGSEVSRARVRNQAKLAYPSVGAWLDGASPPPPALARLPVIQEQLRLQDEAATRLRERRLEQGALELETGEARAVLRDGEVVDLATVEKNRAQDLIADAMIAANGAVARFLGARGYPSLRRVVKVPERWDRIVALAAQLGSRLPPQPDGRALEAFLRERRAADPLRFQNLSLSVVKLIGKGEYAVERPGQQLGHFGLAVRDYAHSTAPNRRYPDLIAHRLLKAALRGAPPPYGEADLASLAAHCTEQEDNAQKVERRLRKSAAAMLLSRRIGDSFDAVVTGAGPKGVWARTLHPPVEGRIVRGEQGLDVGDRTRVRLVAVDVERGFIDFARG
jgi:exoribonuclease-2